MEASPPLVRLPPDDLELTGTSPSVDGRCRLEQARPAARRVQRKAGPRLLGVGGLYKEADLRAALLEVSAVDLPDRARADKEYT